MAVYLGSNKVAAHGGLPSGGGGGSVEAKDVNFYDYDGTIVASYSKNDFLALTQMPSNPDHSGDTIPLTSQGWNWSLADAKTYVTSYGMLEIGQQYVPTDDKTHIVIELIDKNRLSPYLRLSVNGTITIDWGDGNTSTVTGTSLSTAQQTQHVYTTVGTYDITVTLTSGSGYAFRCTSSYLLLNANNSSVQYNRVYAACIRQVFCGSSCNHGSSNYALYYCSNVETVTVPKTATGIGTNSPFYFCFSLKSFTFPENASTGGLVDNCFYQCASLRSVSLPKGSRNSSVNNPFSGCYALARVTLPEVITGVGTFTSCYALETAILPKVTSLANQVFYSCYSLQKLVAPDVTSVESSAFYYDYALPSITIPSGVTSIAASAFYYCCGCACFYIKATTPPTLANTNAFSNTDTNSKIVVPDSAVDTYKGASNWSTYANRIIGESDA